MTSVSDFIGSSQNPTGTKAVVGNSSDDTKSRIGDEYILVRKAPASNSGLVKGVGTLCPPSTIDTKIATDVSSAVMLRPSLGAAHAARAIMARFHKSAVKHTDGVHFRTRVISSSSVSSGVGTALAASLAIAPATTAEWTAFQSLFDDYKVIETRTHYLLINSNAPAAATYPWYAVCYDATYGSNPTSVASVMESDNHQVGSLAVTGNFPGSSAPAGSLDGLRHFAVKMPKHPIISPSTVTGGVGISQNLPGSWIDMADATTSAAGYLKFYCEPTASAVITLRQITEFTVIFRQRT
jgi:hypothetical protein